MDKTLKGRPHNIERRELIRSMRNPKDGDEKKSITQIGKALGITRAAVWQYIVKYGLDK